MEISTKLHKNVYAELNKIAMRNQQLEIYFDLSSLYADKFHTNRIVRVYDRLMNIEYIAGCWCCHSYPLLFSGNYLLSLLYV